MLDGIIENLKQLIKKYQPLIGFKEVHLELGRYLVGEAGLYSSRVIDKKDSSWKSYLIVDDDMHQHLVNSG